MEVHTLWLDDDKNNIIDDKVLLVFLVNNTLMFSITHLCFFILTLCKTYLDLRK